jgi:uncharacterized membrane-anchored protein
MTTSIRKLHQIWLLLTVLIGFAPALAHGQEAEESDRTEESGNAPSDQSGQGAALPWQAGPVALQLEHGVKVDLPAGYEFLAQPHAGQVMEKLGNLYNENLLGLIISSSENDDYFVTLRYDEEGFIKDDEEVDGAEILEAMQEGEEEYNEERKKAGFEPIHAAGWEEPPRYDKAQHHLVWGLIVSSTDGDSINYNTRVLGRRGYVSVNLVTDRVHLADHKPVAAVLLKATSFDAGSTYEDFDSSTDKVAEYGLTGLILGGAGLGLAKVAKVGLLAKFGKLILAGLIAGKKVIAVAVIALIAFVKKLMGRKTPNAA